MLFRSVIDPQKEYNIEFLTSRTNLAKDFEALLAEHEFAPHRTRRNGVNLIYVKNSANVERILAFMGAANAAAQIKAQKAVKQVRNQINRHTNCDTANLSKTARQCTDAESHPLFERAERLGNIAGGVAGCCRQTAGLSGSFIDSTLCLL